MVYRKKFLEETFGICFSWGISRTVPNIFFNFINFIFNFFLTSSYSNIWPAMFLKYIRVRLLFGHVIDCHFNPLHIYVLRDEMNACLLDCRNGLARKELQPRDAALQTVLRSTVKNSPRQADRKSRKVQKCVRGYLGWPRYRTQQDFVRYSPWK